MTIKPIYVICGKEKSLVWTQCQQLLDEVIAPDERAMGLFKAEAEQASVSEILDELRTLPFLSTQRVVLISDADKFVSNNRETLERYFDAPCDTGVLILCVSTFPKTTKLCKKLIKVGQLITAEPVKPWQLPQFAASYAAQEHSKTLNKTAAGELVDLVGDNQERICREIDKLAVFVGDNKTITQKDVESLIGHNRLFNIFAVIDSIIEANTAKAIDRLRNVFADDKSAGYTTVGALAFHFRRMFNAKALMDKGVNSSQIAKQLNIWGNREKFFAQIKKVNLKQIGDILGQLAAIDAAIKTGQTAAEVAIEKLVYKLAAKAS